MRAFFPEVAIFQIAAIFQLSPGLSDGFIFKPKTPIWVNFVRPWNGKCCYFCDHLEYFGVIWYNLWQFSIVFGHLEYFSHFGMF
jgi:hypothetical protein